MVPEKSRLRKPAKTWMRPKPARFHRKTRLSTQTEYDELTGKVVSVDFNTSLYTSIAIIVLFLPKPKPKPKMQNQVDQRVVLPVLGTVDFQYARGQHEGSRGVVMACGDGVTRWRRWWRWGCPHRKKQIEERVSKG
eukprot:3477442-Pyramimonas_sp.AAC.1